MKQCPECGKWLKPLGMARHRTMHYDKKREGLVSLCIRLNFKEKEWNDLSKKKKILFQKHYLEITGPRHQTETKKGVDL